MSGIRGIAFDWGGIFTEGTFDSDAILNLATLCGVSSERIERPYLELMEEFEAGAFDMAEFTARFQQEAGLAVDAGRFRQTFLGSGRERREMYQLLASIPDRYSVAVLSNNVPELCDKVRDDERMGRVEKFLFSNELGIRKPDPRAFEALAKAMRLRPEEIVFIDDNADNIAACRRMGFAGVHLRQFEQFRRELKELLPDLALFADD